MTARKNDIKLSRTPRYVSRETGAAELEISPATWDDWVEAGILPPPCMLGTAGTTPRWRWKDVDRKLSGKAESEGDEPFFRGAGNGQTKERKRVAS